jgi:uncharacterized delta-60 repeat protein
MRVIRRVSATIVLAVPLVVVTVTGPVRAADGNLDPTFGTGGKVVSDFGYDDRAAGVAVQPDGRIVTAGTSCNGDILVTRYRPDGSLDPSFDGDGSLCVDVGSGSADQGEEVIVLGDGRLLVAGTSAGNFALVRLNADGTLDSTFGTGGRATYDLGGNEVLHDAALAPDGKVVMAGETTGPGCPNAPTMAGTTAGVAVARVLPNGTLDPTFGVGGGVVRIDPDQVQRGLTVAVEPDGRPVIGGRITSCSRVNIHYSVFRLTTTGVADPTFAPQDPLQESGPTSAADVAIQPDGRILVLIDTFVGPATSPSRDDAFIVIRYNPDGTVDTGFGNGGVATALFGAGRNATPTALVLQGDKILTGGSVDGDFALARFNASGTLDQSFDGDGLVTTDFGGDDAIGALAVDPDGKAVAAGHSGGNVALARYGATTTGSTIPTTNSVATTATTTAVPPARPGADVACSILRHIAAAFRQTPLQPYAALIDKIAAGFCPS